MQPKLRTAIRVLIIAGMIGFGWLYVAGIGPYWEITPDGAAYMDGAEQFVAGERYTAPLHPPVTSLLYAIPLALVGDDYWWFNAMTAAAALLAMIPVFVLFRRLAGSLPAGVIMLLSLGSAHLFQYSAILLSESFFLLFSMTAMMLLVDARDSRNLVRIAAAAFFVLIASMTRMIGFALALAVIVEQLWPFGVHRRPWRKANWVLVGAMGLVLVADVGWELRNARRNISPAQMALQKEPWGVDPGLISPLELGRRVFSKITDFGRIGSALANGAEGAGPLNTVELAMAAAGFALFALGLLGRLRRPTFLDLYVAISLAIFSIYWTEVMYRWFAPMLPLLWFYVWCGMLAVWSWIPDGRPVTRRALVALAVAWIALYLISGARRISQMGKLARTTPVEGSRIKYPANYALQRAAIELRNQPGGPGLVFCQHHEIVRRLTDDRALPFPFTDKWDTWLRALERNKPSFAIADKRKEQVQRYLLPIANEHPEIFNPIHDEADVRVYAITLP